MGTFSVAFRDVPVGTALEDLVGLTGLSLVYSSDVVRDRTTVCRMEEAASEALLRCVVEGAGLDFYRLSSGTYVVIAGPEDLPAFGTVSGRVVDDLTGEPVPFARVGLADGSEASLANAAGAFVLSRLLPGPHELRVSRPGYVPFRLPIEIPSSGALRQSIRLDPTVLELDPLVVEGGSASAGSGLDRWNADELAGAVPLGDDISRRVRSGLGVARRPLFADLSIQGSAPGEHMVRLDGVPVFDPVSLGRSKSAFSPLALRRITLRKAGFAPEHGSFIGGVIDVEHALSGREGPGTATVLFDPFAANAELTLPLRAFGGDGSLMVAGRSSLWDVYREPTLDAALRDWNQIDPVLMRQLVGDGATPTDGLTFDPHRHGSDLGFSDLHAALHLEFAGFRTLRATMYRGRNRVSTELFASGASEGGPTLDRLFMTRDRYEWSNTVGQIRGDVLIGDRASFRMRAWGSRHVLEHEYGMIDGTEVGYAAGVSDVAQTEAALRRELDASPPIDDGNRVEEFGVDATIDLAGGAGHFLTLGTEAVRVRSRTHLRNEFVRPLLTDVESWRLAGFVQDRWTPTRGVTVQGGLRVTSLGGGDAHAEPRGMIRFDAADRSLGPWSVQVEGGVHRQFMNPFELTNVGPSALVPEVRFWLPADRSLEPARARHLSGSATVRPSRGWELEVEGYHKWLDRILALDYGVLLAQHGGTPAELSQADFVGEAEGVAYGAGARASWEAGRAQLRIRYDWSVSERTYPSRFGGERQPTPWSEPHAASIQGRVPLVGGLALEADVRSVWGRKWGLRRAYYDFLTLHDIQDGPHIGLPDEQELPRLQQVDLGASWLGYLRGRVTELRAEVRNALGGRQVLDYSLLRASAASGPDSYERVERLLPGAALILSFRIGL